MPKKVDPNEGLAADAVLAEDLGDEEERRLAQLAEMGGEVDKDIDDWDDKDLDRGDDPNYVAPAKDDDDDDDKGDDDKGDDDKGDDDTQKGDDDTQKGDDDTQKGDDDGKNKKGSEDKSKEQDGEDDDKPKEGKTEDPSEAGEEPKDDSEPIGEGKDKVQPTEKAQGIPKYRFDEVNERAKKAEAEIERRDTETAAAKKAEENAFDFDAKEKEYMEVLLDGKTDKALELRKEIDAAKEVKWKSETTAETRVAVDSDAEQTELTSLSDQAQDLYPVFDPKHEDFDQAMIKRVLVYYQGYAVSGEAKNKGDAFVMALADVVQQEKLDEKYGDAKPDPKPKEKKVDDPKAEKKRKDKEKLAGKTHRPVAGEGTSSDSSGAVVPDIDKMTDEEMEALPPAALARIRGDFI